MKLKFILIFACGALLFVGGCGKDAAVEVDSAPEESVEEVDEAFTIYEGIDLPKGGKVAVDAEREFAVNLFKEMNHAGKSICVSPLSLYSALAIACSADNGDTGEKLSGLLTGGKTSPAVIGEYLGKMLEALPKGDPFAFCKIDNSIFHNPGLQLSSVVNETLAGLGGSVFDVAPSGESGKSAINEWVSNATGGRIPEFLTLPLDAQIVATIINAVYFKGCWHDAFDEKNNVRRPFLTLNGQEVEKEYMTKTCKKSYYSSDGWIMVSEIYGKYSHRMNLYIPAEGNSLEDLIADLTPEVLNRVRSSSNCVILEYSIPHFNVDSEIDFLTILRKMTGLEGGINLNHFFNSGNQALDVSTIMHKANISVDNEGTEASATTLIGMAGDSGYAPDYYRVDFNRPFIYTIEEISTGTILFMGSVTE